jgi:hypothetical protein
MPFVELKNRKINIELKKIAQLLMRQGGTPRLIVIDDYPYNIRAVQIMFSRAGIEVEGETFGEKGL